MAQYEEEQQFAGVVGGGQKKGCRHVFQMTTNVSQNGGVCSAIKKSVRDFPCLEVWSSMRTFLMKSSLLTRLHSSEIRKSYD